MIRQTIRQVLFTVGLLASSVAAASAAPPTFTIVTQLPDPGVLPGITESSPGTFLIEAIAGTTDEVLSATTQGTKTHLATFPSDSDLESTIVTGPDGRFYASVETDDKPTTVFSVTSAPGSEVLYLPQVITPSLMQSLPNGEFLGLGVHEISMAPVYSVITCGIRGNVTLVYQFPSGETAEEVMRADDGNYYGVEAQQNGSGYVFRLTPSGTLTTLYSFPVETFIGPFPMPLIQSTDGNLYGAIATGGANGTGLIYKLSLSGDYAPVYTFPTGYVGGPTRLLEASDGNFYGSTMGNRQVRGSGVSGLFEVTKAGEYTQLPFQGYCDCPMVQASDGILYGTVSFINVGTGAIFALDAGLPKPAPHAQHFNPATGPVGTPVLIWGTQLLSPSVTFNGVPATAVSSSGSNYVWATVPAAASTGPITITTPGGSITTTNSFTVE